MEEVKRSPIAAMSGVAGVVIAALSLGLAWFQFGRAPHSAAPATAVTNLPPTDVNLGNVFLVIAYFLSVTIVAALLLRAIGRKHDITAIFASIPLVALTNFSAILVIYLAPPRPLSPQLFTSAHDLVFYASAAIVIAFCGKAVLVDIVSTDGKMTSESETKSSRTGGDLGFLLIVLILLAMWSWLVFAGQTRLTRTLLPEVTHPADVKQSKGDT